MYIVVGIDLDVDSVNNGIACLDSMDAPARYMAPDSVTISASMLPIPLWPRHSLIMPSVLLQPTLA